MNKIYWTLGDTTPFTATLKDANGAVNLAGASVRFLSTMGDLDSEADIVDAAAGQVSFTPVDGDLVAGSFVARFVVTFPDGQVTSFPNAEPYIPVTVAEWA